MAQAFGVFLADMVMIVLAIAVLVGGTGLFSGLIAAIAWLAR